MSWQDDLTALDAARASGGIDAPEYRRRKDAILAEATGPTRNAPWRSRNPGADGSQRDTAHQAGSGQDGERPTASMLPPPWERATAQPVPEPREQAPPTEEPYFPPVPPPASRQQPAEQQQTAQQQPQFPPVPQQSTGRPAQTAVPQQQQGQPAQFTQQRPWPHPTQRPPSIEHAVGGGRKPRSRKGLLFAGIGVLVLALVAIGIFVVPWRSLSVVPTLPTNAPNTSNAPSTAPNPTGPATVPANVTAALPELPGTALAAPVRQPVNALEKDGYYGKEIVAAVNKAGTNSMVLRESVDGGDLIYLNAVIPMTSARGCQATAAAINNHQRGLGFTDDDKAGFAANVVTLAISNKAGTYYRSAYCSGRMTVLIGAATANKQKSASLQKGFTTTSKAIVGRLPAN